MDDATDGRTTGQSRNAAVQVELEHGRVAGLTISPVWRREAFPYDLQVAVAEALNDALDARARALAATPVASAPPLTGDDLRALVRHTEERA